MDEITLALENIEYKLRKLIERNRHLLHRIAELEKLNEQLHDEIRLKTDGNARLREELIAVKSAKSLEGMDKSMAKQKINELLREIEKSTVLLNR